jgi:hypothetical protein
MIQIPVRTISIQNFLGLTTEAMIRVHDPRPKGAKETATSGSSFGLLGTQGPGPS